MGSGFNWNEFRLSRRPFSGRRGTLDVVNDRLAEDGRWLHATKGFRTISDKRMQAIAAVAEIRQRVFSTPNGPRKPKYTPHQGPQECARRRCQMTNKGDSR